MCKCNHNHTNSYNLNVVLKTDPTRTVTLRTKFMNDMTRRFKKLRRDIYESVYTNDCFGLKPRRGLKFDAAIPHRQYAFLTDSAKHTAFMTWLQEQIQTGILNLVPATGQFITTDVPWTNIYVDAAYKKGIRRAYSELEKSGYTLPPRAKYPFRTALTMPVSAEKLQLLYSRTFEELKGVTSAMSQQISRTLAQGLAEGKGALPIAKTLNDRVSKIGITRARTIARTETIRAHHVANIETYKEAGVQGVKVIVEIGLAGDACPDCVIAFEGQTFTLKEIEGELPYHPNCRCIAIPRVVRQRGYAQKEVRLIRRFAKEQGLTEAQAVDRWVSSGRAARYAGKNRKRFNLPPEVRAVKRVGKPTVEQAEQYAKNELGMTLDGKKYNLQDTSVIDIYNKTLKGFKEKGYNFDLRFYGTVKKKGVFSSANYLEMDLSPYYVNNKKLFEAALKRQVKTGYSPAGCDTIKSVVDHEFAHSLSARDIRQKGVGFYKEARDIRRAYIREGERLQKKHSIYSFDYARGRASQIGLTDTSNTKGFLADWKKVRISGYAESSLDEFVAESFTMALNSPKPSPFALRMLELLNKYYKK